MDYDVVYQAAREAGADETLTLIIVIVIAILSGSGIVSVVIKKMLKSMERRAIEREKETLENRVERQMLLGISHDRIVHLAKQHIKAGSITIEDYENISKYLYEPYKGLCGNGKVGRMMKEVEKLPIVPSEYTDIERAG